MLFFSKISQCVKNASEWPDTDKESVNEAYDPFYIWHLSLNTIMSLEALECRWKIQKVTYLSFLSNGLFFYLLLFPPCHRDHLFLPLLVSASFLSSHPPRPPEVCILFSFSLFSSLLFFPLSISAGFLYPFLSCFLICSYPSPYHLFLVFSDIFTSLSWSSLLPPSILPSFSSSPLLSWVFDSFYKHQLKAPVTGCC